MSKKSLLYIILFLVLGAGNIYFACRYFASARKVILGGIDGVNDFINVQT